MKIGSIADRVVTIDRKTVDAKERKIPLSFSSDAPVLRDGFYEILDHSPGAADFSRAPFSLVVEHDGRDLVGTVEDVQISQGKGRGVGRFGKGARATEVWDDVTAGIRRNASIRYVVHDTKPEGRRDGLPVFRVTKWEAVHVSFVSDPADKSVGVHRSIQMKNLDHNPADGGGGTDADEIAAIGRQCGKSNPEIERYCTRAIVEGKSLAEVRQTVLTRYMNARPVTTPDTDIIGMTDREEQNYSLTRAIARTSSGKALDGFELECSRQVEKQVGRSPEGGFYLPGDLRIRQVANRMRDSFREMNRLNSRALEVGTFSTGGALVEAEVLGSNLIEFLRNKQVLAALGARPLSGLVGDIAIPTHTGTALTYWLAENAAVTAADLSLGQVLGTPHRVSAMSVYSRQLVAQSNIDIENLVRSDLLGAIAAERDKVGIQGSGVSGEPTGIINWQNINATVTFGGAPEWVDVCEFENGVEVDNALEGRLAYVSTPAVRKKWKTTVKVTGYPVYLLEGNTTNGYPFVATNQAPSSNRVIFGNFADMYLLDWAGVIVQPDPYTLADKFQTRVVVTQLVDNIIRHAVSFNVSTDSGAQ